MKPYTGTGDDGKSYIKGGRIDKDSLVFEAIGDLDELVSLLGIIRSLSKVGEINEILRKVQEDVFHLNSHLAGFREEFGEKELKWTEMVAEELSSKLPELKRFVLPSGSLAVSMLHLSRAVCRRAERRLVSLSKEKDVDRWVIPYVNRLSSLLFVLARYEALKEGRTEEYV